MKFRNRFISAFFGDIIEQKVSERLKAASIADIEKEDIGWRKLTGNITRDLTPLKQDRMIQIAFYLWENNPLARWLIEITKDFILAEGLPYECKDEDVKQVLDDFWHDPINRMDLYLEKYVRELFLYGELCFPVFTAQQTGKVRLGYIDPAQIKEVVTDPENVKAVIGIIMKDSARQAGMKLKTILPKDAEFILSRSAQTLRATYMDGECFFFAINNVTNSPRGRSKLLAIADWLDAYEQFLFDYSDKWPLLNTFVWDMKVEGGDESAIKEQMKAFTKKSGSIFAHNEKVTLEAATPDLKAIDAETGARLFRNHILGAMGYPEHWFGGGGDVNRATAVEMGTPAFKTLSSKQRYVKYILETILEHVITKALDANYLRVTEPDAYDFSVITPELSSKDVTKYASMMQQVVASLVSAEMQGWIDRQTAQKIFANLINYFGVEIDVEEMEKAISEKEDKKGYEDYLKKGQGSGSKGQDEK